MTWVQTPGNNPLIYYLLFQPILKYWLIYDRQDYAMSEPPLSRPGTVKNFATGDIIMRQGDEGECAYVIEDGEVDIVLDNDGREQSVGKRGPGTIIGEMALIDKAPRTATVRAAQPCTLLQITLDDFTRRLCDTDPVIQMVMRVMLTRYRDVLTRAEIHERAGGEDTVALKEQDYVRESEGLNTLKLEKDFRKALDNGELVLHYQPIIHLHTGKLCGFESLMRWNHPEKGMVSPGVFIPVAEDSGMIVEASQWALEESCAALRRMTSGTGTGTGTAATHADVYMSVNFTSQDFAQAGFLSDILQIINAHDLDPGRIQLEITERLLIQDPGNAKKTLQMCRDAGLSIAIDDFGTGYSSLSYLHYYPINRLKIDRAFVQDMNKGESSSLSLVQSIIALGENLGMATIAEGVEDMSEITRLRELGCNTAQGFYLARPMPEDKATDFLHNWDPEKIKSA